MDPADELRAILQEGESLATVSRTSRKAPPWTRPATRARLLIPSRVASSSADVVRWKAVSLLLVLATMLTVPSLIADSGIVSAQRVRLRRGPSLGEAIMAELPAGVVADILDVTSERYRIDKAREFSYSWYNIALPDGVEGWIYGQYFYPLEYEEPGTVAIDGERYRLAVFREDGYLNDMPSQDQYSLPCFLRERDSRAVTLGIRADVYRRLPNYGQLSGRQIVLPGAIFLLVSNAGTNEEIAAVTVGGYGSSAVLRLKVDFSLQAGGGTYTLMLVPPAGAADSFTVADVEDIEVRSGL